MIFLSLNIKWFLNPPKAIYLKELMDNIGPVILLLQETMTIGDIASEFSLKLHLSRKCCCADEDGYSWGTLVAWDSPFNDFTSYLTCTGIYFKGNLRGLERYLSLMNIYGPYGSRHDFLD